MNTLKENSVLVEDNFFSFRVFFKTARKKAGIGEYQNMQAYIYDF